VPQELDLPEDTDVKGQRMIYKALHRNSWSEIGFSRNM
jgi:hypothetical protein